MFKGLITVSSVNSQLYFYMYPALIGSEPLIMYDFPFFCFQHLKSAALWFRCRHRARQVFLFRVFPACTGECRIFRDQVCPAGWSAAIMYRSGAVKSYLWKHQLSCNVFIDLFAHLRVFCSRTYFWRCTSRFSCVSFDSFAVAEKSFFLISSLKTHDKLKRIFNIRQV